MRKTRWIGAGLIDAIVLGGVIALGVGALGIGLATPAQARVFVGIGIGVPLFAPPLFAPPLFAPWYYPPAFYAPRYLPPPVVYAPPVAYQQQPTYVAPQKPVWYYCDNPRGYYPYVGSCQEGWRTVPATPPEAGR